MYNKSLKRLIATVNFKFKIFRKFYSSSTQPQTYKMISPKEIALNPTEAKISKLLNEFTNYYNTKIIPELNSSNNRELKTPITLRITGGWVRDKLLGKQSHDIDIGIDGLSGVDFVTGLKAYVDEKEAKEQQEQSEEDGEQQSSTLSSSMYKIAKNPEKSKHLETCTTKIYGLDIDFVNLRSETYTELSRIPAIETGTPLQDAYRRDATLNSMFYNLSTCQIEDFTGFGLDDLKNGILRTPLDPEKTFLDDPLRCLRLIRFASTYNFKIEPNTLTCMKLDSIKLSLNEKISRERIGVEFKKIINNGNIIYGLELINEVGFHDILFGLNGIEFKNLILKNPADIELIEYNDNKGLHESLKSLTSKLPLVLEILKSIPQFSKILDVVNSSEFDRAVFYLCLILRDWIDLKIKLGKRDTFASTLIIVEGLKLPLKLGDLVGLIISNRLNFNKKLEQLDQLTRSELSFNFFIPFNKNWELNLLVNLVIKLLDTKIIDNQLEIDSIIGHHLNLFKLAKDLRLENVHESKLLINGKELSELMNMKSGPWLKKVNEDMFVYQLDNPDLTKGDMIKYLKNYKLDD